MPTLLVYEREGESIAKVTLLNIISICIWLQATDVWYKYNVREVRFVLGLECKQPWRNSLWVRCSLPVKESKGTTWPHLDLS